MIDSFVAHLKERGHAARTVSTYRHNVELFARWFQQTNGEAFSKTNITQTDVREYRQHMIATGKRPASINTGLAAIKALAAWLDIPVQVAGIEQQALAPRWLDKRDQAKLIREAEREVKTGKRKSGRNLAIIVLLLNTGLRVSELCDIVPSNVAVGSRSGTITVTGKGSKRRVITLNRDARAALAALPLPIGLKPGQVQRAIAEVARRAGVVCTPHTLRHTFAHNLLPTTDQATVAALLGHANLNTTRRYTTPGQADLQTAVDRLD